MVAKMSYKSLESLDIQGLRGIAWVHVNRYKSTLEYTRWYMIGT